LLEAEPLPPRLVRGDRRALDPHPVLLDRVRRFDGDPVLGRVAALDPEVEVDQLDVQVREDELLLDERPDDPCHLVAVELDHRVLDFDLLHAGGDAIDWLAKSVWMATVERGTTPTLRGINKPR